MFNFPNPSSVPKTRHKLTTPTELRQMKLDLIEKFHAQRAGLSRERMARRLGITLEDLDTLLDQYPYLVDHLKR